MGRAFARELERRGWEYVGISREKADYTRFERLRELLDSVRPGFLINAAGYAGKPNVDACEQARAETLLGNTLLPQTIAHACAVEKVPWGHVSSGCIYTGAKVVRGGTEIVERDLMQPEIRAGIDAGTLAVRGFKEEDEPNFSFRSPPCSFYSGTKALAEETIRGVGENYLWRLRIPFDHEDHPKNYLTKLQKYSRVYDNFNSLSHRHDFVSACLDLWERRAPFGTYNITNPGFVSARAVVAAIQRIMKPTRAFEFWASDEEFYAKAAAAPRSNCILDVTKLLGAGVRMRSVDEAISDSLTRWV